MLVLARIERRHRTVQPARRHHRDLALEVDEPLEDRRRRAVFRQRRRRAPGGGDARLPLADVA
jgi:hypothetical protein